MQENENEKILPWMFTVALLSTANNWKQPECQSTGEWINNLKCSHTMEPDSVRKRAKVLM